MRLPPWARSAAGPAGAFALAVAYLLWWMHHNPLPDGYQNEYLHVGNALDLYEAARARDLWSIRWIMYTGYWPWGALAVPFPFLAVLGPGRLGLVLGNVVHLAVLLWGAVRLGRSCGAPLTPYLLLLCPGVFGALVRFEPNFADVAWTAAGLSCLVRSHGLRRWPEVLGWGACLGVGLLLDRLAVGFFLLPAAAPLALRSDGPGRRRLGAALLLALLICGAYYREFFLRHTGELLGQVPAGEIDASGALTEGSAMIPALYYVLGLMDAQAGPWIGALMLIGAGAGLGRLRAGGSEPVLLAGALPAGVLFTLIAKKQLFYTLPALAPLAVLAATRGRWAWIGVAGGLYAFAAQGLGWVPGGPWMPEEWVAPRHVLARPPSGQRWPFPAIAAAVEGAGPGDEILVWSEDTALYEGYLVLTLRELAPGARVRGVLTDPQGTYELMSEQDFVVTATPPGAGWPGSERVRAELREDHYVLADLPPVDTAVAEAGADFEPLWSELVVAAPELEPVELTVYRRRAAPR